MEFTIQRDQLTNAIHTVSKAVSSRTTIPILTGIKIVAHEDGITLTASDSDVSIEQYIPMETEDHNGLTTLRREASCCRPASLEKLSKSCRGIRLRSL